MAEGKESVTLPDGRPIESLRVVDLKQQLKKYGVSINGSKSQLVDRLKAQIYLEELKQAPVHEGVPNQDIVDDESVGSNSFIQQYLKQQQEQLNQRHAREPPASEGTDAKADKGDIPEGLTNQVDELNQSLSRSQSEEAEKEPEETTNGESTADKDAKTAPEEHSPAGRSSRRSRRQSSKQEEEAEIESETRKTRRRTSSRSKEQEEEQEEVKAPPQEVEPMQTIEKPEKKVQPQATLDEAQKTDEPAAPKEKVDEVKPAPTQDAENKATIQMTQGEKTEVEEAKDSGAQVEQTSAPRDVNLPDPASSKQTEKVEAGQDQPTEIKEEAREQAKIEAKPTKEVAEDTASQGQANNQVQVAPEKEASHEETGKASETKEEQQSESKQFPSQKRVKLNRSVNLSRSMGSKTAEEEKKPEETEESVPEVSEKGDVPANKNEDKDEHSAPEVFEKTPRKRVTPPDDKDDQDQPDTTSRKRQKTESDEEDAEKGPEESSPPVTSPREDEAAAPEEKPVSMTMGTDEGKDAASAETQETNETEDGEIREEGEVMEAEQGVESNKEKEMESAPSKVEQSSRSRSFTSVSSAPVKTKRHSFSSKDKTKENDGEEDKPEGAVNAPQVKKRRWGSTKKTTADDTMKTNVNISTQLLKDIIPEIKVPLADLELDLEPEGLEGEEAMDVGEVMETKKEEDEEEKPMPMEDEETSQEPPKRKFIRQTITAPSLQAALKSAPQEEESDIDYEEDVDDMVTRKVQQRDEDGADDDGEKEEKENEDEESESSSDEEDKKEDGEKEGEDGDKEERKKNKKKKKETTPKDEGQENKQPEVKVVKKVIQIKRAVRTVIDEPIRHADRDQSPSKRPTSNIVHVINLVRPFTLPQLKELLGRYGTLSADGFWINNIKSHCYATFESSDGAVACRDALHGTTWPSSNPKTLRVEFADLNELQRHMGVVAKKEEVKAEPAQEPAKEPVRGFSARRERILHQDREKVLEQERRTKERERERENSRKGREWDRGKERSRSPDRRRRATRSQERRDRHEAVEVKKEVDEPPAKLLDDLFRKTKATPCIYWLPLTEEQALERDKTKAKLALKREEMRKTAQEERFKGGRDLNRDDRMRREREPERPRARERSWSRQRRSRSRSRGSRRR